MVKSLKSHRERNTKFGMMFITTVMFCMVLKSSSEQINQLSQSLLQRTMGGDIMVIQAPNKFGKFQESYAFKQQKHKLVGKPKPNAKHLDAEKLEALMASYQGAGKVEGHSFISQGIDWELYSDFELRSPYKSMNVRLMATSPNHMETVDTSYLQVSELWQPQMDQLP